MLIIDHSQSALHLLALPSARHHNSPTPQPLLVTCPRISPDMQKYWGDFSCKPNPRWHRGAHAICTTHLCRLTGSDFQAEMYTSNLPIRSLAPHMPREPVIAPPGLTIFCTAPTLQQLVKFDLLSHEREQADESKGSKPKCGGVQEKRGKKEEIH